MKQIMLIISLLGTGFAAEAQTNRTYYTGMQTKEMMEQERTGGNVHNNTVRLSLGTEIRNDGEFMDADTAPIRMNSIQRHEGHSTLQQYYGNTAPAHPEQIRSEAKPYDTSKNNGTCLGCGSGAITDHRPWLMGRRTR